MVDYWIKLKGVVTGWIARRDLLVLTAVLAVVIGLLVFIAIADEVTEGDSHAFDEWIIRSLRQADNPAAPIGPPWLKEVARDGTALGSTLVLALVTGIVVFFLLLLRKFHALVLVLVATAGGGLLSALLKDWFDRPRPSVVPHLTEVLTASFPSGHSMLSAVVYLTLGALLARLVPTRGLKLYCISVALLLSFLVGLTRVYLGVHYPTDVLAGWAAGLVWAVSCWLVARYLQHRGAVEQTINPREGETHESPGSNSHGRR